jgi:hypothetical protein
MVRYKLFDINETFEIIPDGYRGFESKYFLKMKGMVSDRRTVVGDSGPVDNVSKDMYRKLDLSHWVYMEGICATPLLKNGFSHLSDASTISVRMKSLHKCDIDIVSDRIITVNLFRYSGKQFRDTGVSFKMFVDRVYNGDSDYTRALFGYPSVNARSSARTVAYILCRWA